MITPAKLNTGKKKETYLREMESLPRADALADHAGNDGWRYRVAASVRSAKRLRSRRIVGAEDGNQTRTSSPELRWKRGLDLFCIAISLPLIFPLIILIVFWIRLVSRGPSLFRQERIGQDGKRFMLYKFRSMKLNASTNRHERHLLNLVRSDGRMTKLDLLCDSRLIPGGCLLRAAGLDELPQLFNVIRGEMSLVGPRPCLTREYVLFTPKQRERFDVLPGLTGNWQVNGKNQSTFSEMNAMDIDYVHHASLALDLEIMMRTPSVLFLQMRQSLQQRSIVNQMARFQSGDKADSRYSSQRLSHTR